MTDKEKFRAEIEAKMAKYGDTLDGILSDLEYRKELPSDSSLVSALKKYELAKTKVSELDNAGEEGWEEKKKEINYVFNDLNDDLRSALSMTG
jgi:hypothetical protein